MASTVDRRTSFESLCILASDDGLLPDQARCLQCWVVVKKKNLARHLSNSCKGQDRVFSSLACFPLNWSDRTSKSDGAPDCDGIEQEQDEKRIPEKSSVAPHSSNEGTRGLSGSFRDHGKFGSHPSFDAMDDEAQP